MARSDELERFLASASVAPEVFALRPDYRALLIAVAGIETDADASAADALVARAEAFAVASLASTPAEELAHIAAWREAYRSFGAKPQRTRNSLEALTRRAVGGLPRVNSLTDIYNAVSVLHQVPIGGEDLATYAGSPRLVRALGDEPFDTSVDGAPATELPEPGEVVWADAQGVTCRRWNWRQGRRTQLTGKTTAVLFILDALEPMNDDALTVAGDDLVARVNRLGTDVTAVRRVIAAE